MNRLNLTVLLSICILSCGLQAHANYIEGTFYGGRDKGTSSSSTSSGGGLLSQSPFRVAIGLSLGSGTASNQQGTIASRTLNSAAVEGHIGFKSKYFEPFIYGNYEYAQQATNASIVGNTNLSGYGYLAGGGVALDLSLVSISAAYLFLGRFSPTQATASGQTSSYALPTGWRFAIDYEVHPGLLVTASYRISDFSRFEQAGVATDISTNKLSRNSAGLSLSWGF